MKIECCCCEQPISNQKIILTAISLGAHNNNIRFPSQNSASDAHSPLSPHLDGAAHEGVVLDLGAHDVEELPLLLGVVGLVTRLGQVEHLRHAAREVHLGD